VSTLLTSASVLLALADARRGKTRDDVDSRVPGLTLRVKPSGVRWSVHSRFGDKQCRYDLGPAVEGRRDGALCLDTARARAMEVRTATREGRDPKIVLAFLRGDQAAVVELREDIEARRAAAEEAARPKTWT
jgi:hypothetical protein